MTFEVDRRTVLRGMLYGGAVTVGIPLLDGLLGTSGEALASGAPLPTRFGTYFWGLGLTPGRWVPATVGPGYEITPELAPLAPLRDKLSVFSGFRVLLDGRPNFQHWTGQAAVMCGQAASAARRFDRASFDTAVADTIGVGTRYRSLEVTPFGNARLSYSSRGNNNFNPAEPTPLSLYMRIFGEGFQDPNTDTWRPDPSILLRQSVLSAVKEERQQLVQQVGGTDRQRLDQYFTSLREMEGQLAVQLQKPAPAEACVPGSLERAQLEDKATGADATSVRQNNKLMAELIAMALACNQTRVFNVVFTSATAEIYLPGDSKIYHLHTHEEPVSDQLGYQPTSAKLAEISIGGFAEFLLALDAIREGDGTLLDHTIVLGYSDSGYAKIHSTDNIPLFLAGGANGRHKSGMHVAVKGEPVTRVALTAQQLAGLSAGSWGYGSMQTSKPLSEVIA
jgi:hypothetical protein